ncbi:hypothetical protein CYMTET_5153 [Cymbomonas tetramitiformis]|uniref:Uncharacterized protein n=1 Tax=Cymbomonas tetramitiformis TaxID=36881 RepID=A0AAE0LJR4_9CHLO|nr:hypothetical protein CYMTET_5153 [Cymbomonas tetramitiformis]
MVLSAARGTNILKHRTACSNQQVKYRIPGSEGVLAYSKISSMVEFHRASVCLVALLSAYAASASTTGQSYTAAGSTYTCVSNVEGNLAVTDSVSALKTALDGKDWDAAKSAYTTIVSDSAATVKLQELAKEDFTGMAQFDTFSNFYDSATWIDDLALMTLDGTSPWTDDSARKEGCEKTVMNALLTNSALNNLYKAMKMGEDGETGDSQAPATWDLGWAYYTGAESSCAPYATADKRAGDYGTLSTTEGLESTAKANEQIMAALALAKEDFSGMAQYDTFKSFYSSATWIDDLALMTLDGTSPWTDDSARKEGCEKTVMNALLTNSALNNLYKAMKMGEDGETGDSQAPATWDLGWAYYTGAESSCAPYDLSKELSASTSTDYYYFCLTKNALAKEDFSGMAQYDTFKSFYSSATWIDDLALMTLDGTSPWTDDSARKEGCEKTVMNALLTNSALNNLYKAMKMGEDGETGDSQAPATWDLGWAYYTGAESSCAPYDLSKELSASTSTDYYYFCLTKNALAKEDFSGMAQYDTFKSFYSSATWIDDLALMTLDGTSPWTDDSARKEGCEKTVMNALLTNSALNNLYKAMKMGEDGETGDSQAPATWDLGWAYYTGAESSCAPYATADKRAGDYGTLSTTEGPAVTRDACRDVWWAGSRAVTDDVCAMKTLLDVDDADWAATKNVYTSMSTESTATVALQALAKEDFSGMAQYDTFKSFYSSATWIDDLALMTLDGTSPWTDDSARKEGCEKTVMNALLTNSALNNLYKAMKMGEDGDSQAPATWDLGWAYYTGAESSCAPCPDTGSHSDGSDVVAVYGATPNTAGVPYAAAGSTYTPAANVSGSRAVTDDVCAMKSLLDMDDTDWAEMKSVYMSMSAESAATVALQALAKEDFTGMDQFDTFKIYYDSATWIDDLALTILDGNSPWTHASARKEGCEKTVMNALLTNSALNNLYKAMKMGEDGETGDSQAPATWDLGWAYYTGAESSCAPYDLSKELSASTSTDYYFFCLTKNVIMAALPDGVSSDDIGELEGTESIDCSGVTQSPPAGTAVSPPPAGSRAVTDDVCAMISYLDMDGDNWDSIKSVYISMSTESTATVALQALAKEDFSGMAQYDTFKSFYSSATWIDDLALMTLDGTSPWTDDSARKEGCEKTVMNALLTNSALNNLYKAMKMGEDGETGDSQAPATWDLGWAYYTGAESSCAPYATADKRAGNYGTLSTTEGLESTAKANEQIMAALPYIAAKDLSGAEGVTDMYDLSKELSASTSTDYYYFCLTKNVIMAALPDGVSSDDIGELEGTESIDCSDVKQSPPAGTAASPPPSPGDDCSCACCEASACPTYTYGSFFVGSQAECTAAACRSHLKFCPDTGSHNDGSEVFPFYESTTITSSPPAADSSSSSPSDDEDIIIAVSVVAAILGLALIGAGAWYAAKVSQGYSFTKMDAEAANGKCIPMCLAPKKSFTEDIAV